MIGQDLLGALNFFQSWETIAGNWQVAYPGATGQFAITSSFNFHNAGVEVFPETDTTVGDLAKFANGLSLQVSILNVLPTGGGLDQAAMADILANNHTSANNALHDVSTIPGAVSSGIGSIATIAVVALIAYVLIEAGALKKLSGRNG